MSVKTAKKNVHENGAKEAIPVNPSHQLITGNWMDLAMAAIFNTMRILKSVNPGDAYYENYLAMRARYGEEFFDTYQLLWKIGVTRPPKRILEIGTRTGISLCQLLSSMSHEALSNIEKIVCVDPFDQWTSANLVRANLKYLNLPYGDKVKILAMRSDSYFQNTDTLFDYILVDGDHSKPAAAADLDAAVNLIEPGGIIVFDDISTAPGECALIDVWKAWKEKHENKFWFKECMDGKGVAWAIKK